MKKSSKVILSKNQHGIYYIKDGVSLRDSIIGKDLVTHFYPRKNRIGQEREAIRKAGTADAE